MEFVLKDLSGGQKKSEGGNTGTSMMLDIAGDISTPNFGGGGSDLLTWRTSVLI